MEESKASDAVLGPNDINIIALYDIIRMRLLYTVLRFVLCSPAIGRRREGRVFSILKVLLVMFTKPLKFLSLLCVEGFSGYNQKA